MAKRLFPRIRSSVPVSFDCGDGVVCGRTENLSLRGMRVAAVRAPEAGAFISVDLELPVGRTTRLEARVVSVDPPALDGPRTFALELTHSSDDFAAFLGLLVGAQVRKASSHRG